ncbi:37848_t:CDS:1, partial [Gigaspora margarita]
MSTSKNNNNFQENLDKIPSLNLEIVELKSDILELFNIIESLQNSTNNDEQLENLYNQI